MAGGEIWDFYYARETCSLASHIAIEEAGAPFRIHRLDIDTGDQHRAEYLAINAKARVPALVTPRGVLTETPAILAFIAHTFPEAHLAPMDDPFEFARFQEFNAFIVSTLHVAHAHRMRGHRWADDPAAIRAMQRKVPETVAAGFVHIEERYLLDPYVLDSGYSLADAYLFTLARWMELDGVDPKDFPKVRAHREMMTERPAVQRALAAQFAD